MKCAYDQCNKDFEPKTHNQKYCSDECCRIATNEKLKEQYYEKKARLQGKVRICKSAGCKTSLSRYNEGNICSRCQGIEKEKERKALIEMMKNVTS
jgi:hypothetical protein